MFSTSRWYLPGIVDEKILTKKKLSHSDIVEVKQFMTEWINELINNFNGLWPVQSLGVLDTLSSSLRKKELSLLL